MSTVLSGVGERHVQASRLRETTIYSPWRNSRSSSMETSRPSSAFASLPLSMFQSCGGSGQFGNPSIVRPLIYNGNRPPLWLAKRTPHERGEDCFPSKPMGTE
jgi:hypothetical protein